MRGAPGFFHRNVVLYSRLGRVQQMSASQDRKRTAVLVVHGMGSQRPLETVRGVVNAVWRDNPKNKVWFHPETSGTDIDLTVQTTSNIPNADGTIPKIGRRIDFHELYWAHLIAETRAVAVLLWLFELARRGPYLKIGMRPFWWVGAVYLCFLLLSVSYLASDVVERLARIENERIAMILTPTITVAVVAALCTFWSALYGSGRILLRSAGLAAVAIGALYWVRGSLGGNSPLLESLATHFLPAGFALFVAVILMGKRFVWAPFFFAYLISILFHLVQPAIVSGINPLDKLKGCGWPPCPALLDFAPWSLQSPWSSVAAWLFISSYVVLSAAFLQPYLGDVARYLRNSPANIAGRREIRRNAVDTLLALHDSGKYDRIIVVAHSLGSVVAYDMLRAAFARVFRHVPVDREKLNPEFDRIDTGSTSREAWRKDARVVMRKLYELVADLRRKTPALPIGAPADPRIPRAWLVTDFITLGSPLTHAHYLLWRSPDGKPPKDRNQLVEDFKNRVDEREYPTCRPKAAGGDNVLTYHHDNSATDRLHHAAVFGLTRWTNLYFELDQVFWGDAIGGPVGTYDTGRTAEGEKIMDELFGTDVIDVPVSTRRDGKATLFTHTTYWSVKRDTETEPNPCDDEDPPHIRALKFAIDLADRDKRSDSEKP